MTIAHSEYPGAVGNEIFCAGDDYGGVAGRGQGLCQLKEIRLDVGGVDALCLDVGTRGAGDLGGVSLDDIDAGTRQKLRGFLVAERGGTCATRIKNYGDAPLIRGARGGDHGGDEIGSEGADVQHESGGDACHVGDFLGGVRHDGRTTDGFNDLRAIVNSHPIGEVVDHGLLLAHFLQQIKGSVLHSG